jgi:hypothetical protein
MRILPKFREDIDAARRRVRVGTRLAETALGTVEYVVSGAGDVCDALDERARKSGDWTLRIGPRIGIFGLEEEV